MDIFNEVKEAVLSATPGEDTRNYYRNQGMKIERERIIKLLEEKMSCDGIECNVKHPYGAWCQLLQEELKPLIKGETNE